MRKSISAILVIVLLLTVTLVVAQEGKDVTFLSTQGNTVEAAELIRDILAQEGFDFQPLSYAELFTQVMAEAETGQGEIDLLGDLHGGFPPMAAEGALMNLIDVLEDLEADREFIPSMVELGLLDSDDYLYYVPWMQATYIMAATQESLEYLPEGADINALTWDEFASWCQIIVEETGSPRCGVPYAGLFHRFLEGYMWPSFTGGMVTQFNSEAAADMLAWARDDLWPYLHPESISYEFMEQPLLAGDVWVAFDHTARLNDALNEDPDNYVAFPAPAGPMGRGFMPVVVGLAVPETAGNFEGAVELIDFLTQPTTQDQMLGATGFFPVVAGVDTSNMIEGVQMQVAAVEAQSASEDALPALLPVGLGDRGGEINNIFRAAFARVVLDGEDIQTVLDEEAENLQTLLDETGAPCWAPDPASDGACQIAE